MFEPDPYPRRHWCPTCLGFTGPGSPCATDPEPEPEPADQPDEENHEDDDTR